uniref:LSM5 homolog, U6 small nuclear RNA and mRNA degradation associated n=1 Tax=Buteo japonicus TaxID=224669 RepID=A0A8C0HQ37_9AVES
GTSWHRTEPGQLTQTELVDKCVGPRIHIVMKNMVLEDVTEFEIPSEGRRITKLDQILLNGNNITMVSHHC